MKSARPIVGNQEIEVSTQTLWNALTNVHKMRQWYFDNIPDFERKNYQAALHCIIKNSL